MTEKKPSLRKALRVRTRARNKKPAFERPESWRYDKFSLSWRRPRGLDNKVRRKIKGWPPSPSMGYKGPKATRGLHPSGYREILVSNVKAVSTVDPATQAIRIAHTVGRKKRALIVAEAEKLNIKVLNIKLVKEEPTEEAAEDKEESKEGKEVKEEEKEEAEKEEEPKKPKKETKRKKGEDE